MRAGLIVMAVLLGCARQDEGASGPQGEAAAALFEESLHRCEKNSDCVTGLCDLTPSFTVSVSSGYCMSLPNAFDRWQRLALGMKAGEIARRDLDAGRSIVERAKQELSGYATPATREAMAFLLKEVGTEGAMEELRVLHAREPASSPMKRLTGLLLAEAGDPAGEDDLVEASLSSLVEMRMHAARAARGLDNETARRILAALAQDPHPLVRQAVLP